MQIRLCEHTMKICLCLGWLRTKQMSRCFYHIFNHFTRFRVLKKKCLKRGASPSPPPHTMDPPMFRLNKLLKTLINSFVDFSGEA